MNRKLSLERISIVTSKIPNEPLIYVLNAKIGKKMVPVYVGKTNTGKTNTPLKRWNQHLMGLESGIGHYSKWRNLLVENGKAKVDTALSLIPSSTITKPPIPNLPLTVGAVEYQLVDLISKCFPETSLM